MFIEIHINSLGFLTIKCHPLYIKFDWLIDEESLQKG